MESTCRHCSKPFVITDDDVKFYDEVSPVFLGKKESIPPPSLCPSCRMQQRLQFRNERSLHKGVCDLTGKSMVSAYPSDKPFNVYENSEWWSDKWDPLEHGRDPDFSRPFFEQFGELLYKTPFINLLNSHTENSDYTMNASYNKDCYFLFCASYNESCLYCYWAQQNTSCVDCMGIRDCELCYECSDCFNHCYKLFHSHNCRGCSDSRYLYDCIGCKDCMACTGLRNKQYCWLNEEIGKEEYQRRLTETLNNPERMEEVINAFNQLTREFTHPWSQQKMTEDCTGDYIYESSNCKECYDARHSEDCTYCQGIVECKECMDITYFGFPGERLYSCNNIGLNAYNCLFSSYGYSSHDITHCYGAHNCSDCFGCANMHHKQYCILNKQYSKEEYEILVPKIIEHMRSTGEWGEFLPAIFSPFAYNETVAQEYFPLLEEQVRKNGWKWRTQADEMPQVERVIPAEKLPNCIEDIPDDVLNWAITCELSHRPFKITTQELAFYRRMGLALPHLHPDERHKRRMQKRNPRILWKRSCSTCGSEIESTFAPEKPEKVLCELCYLATVY